MQSSFNDIYTTTAPILNYVPQPAFLLIRVVVIADVEVAQIVRVLRVGNNANVVAQRVLLQELLCEVLRACVKKTRRREERERV